MVNWQLLRYLLASYTRSYKYFAPIAFMIITVMLLYSYKPSPVLDSYAVTSTLLFIGFAWLSLNYLNHDQGQQISLLILHTRSARTFFFTQYSVLIMMSLVVSILSVIYPMVTHMFAEPVGIMRFCLALLAHIFLAWLGSTIALFFQSGWMENHGRAVGMLLVLIVLSIAGLSITDYLPHGFVFIAYLLPPVSLIIDMLMHADERRLWISVIALTYSLVYTVVLVIVYIKAACAKDATEFNRKSG